MGVTIKPELSRSNPYWISKHRYYELKHFCMQYREWGEMVFVVDGYMKPKLDIRTDQHYIADPTAKASIKRLELLGKIKMLQEAAEKADPFLSDYILRGVTSGMSYDEMNAKKPIPCCRDIYYERCRKFFWILDKLRE